MRREFDGYLDCGLLCRGFARMKCAACVEQHLVAFSCKGRGFCPSCLGRRMCQTAANLVEHVLPPVPLRQWVITLRFELVADGVYVAAATGGLAFRSLPHLSTTDVADALQVARARILRYLERCAVIR
ncbi:MAG TPA: transposase zinc-binding domain-containing protein, partial [Polyangiaceae bacterium]|nr:transposase zinc-binding domain-containing protein [Polyangiaceae bacterium]